MAAGRHLGFSKIPITFILLQLESPNLICFIPCLYFFLFCYMFYIQLVIISQVYRKFIAVKGVI